MGRRRIPRAIQEFVRSRAEGRCEYCHASELLAGMHYEIDHIVPRARGGSDSIDNLCLACSTCNGHKSAKTTVLAGDGSGTVELFNPRRQQWHEHFAWDESGRIVLGLTLIGEATILALQMNNSHAVAARAIWVTTGKHPPARSARSAL